MMKNYLLLSLSTLALLACSSKQGPQVNIDRDAMVPPMMDAEPPADAALSSNVSVGTGSDALSVQVVAGTVFDGEPVAGGWVYFIDGMSGERFRAQSGSDGRVEITDATITGAAVMAYVDAEHGIASYGALSAAGVTTLTAGGYGNMGGDLVLAVPRRDSATTRIEVSGVVSNQMGESVFVSPVLSGTRSYSGNGTSWNVEVPPMTDFQLVAIDIGSVEAPTVSMRGREFNFHGWATRSIMGAAASIGEQEIDFTAQAMEAMTFAGGSFTVPTGDFFESARPNVYLMDARSLSLIGYNDRVDVNEAGTRVEFSGEYVMPEGVTAALTVYRFDDGPQRSQVIRSGAPSGGVSDLTFLSPPEIVSPRFGVVQGVGDEFEWRANPDAVPQLSVRDADGDLLWRHVVPPGTTMARLPLLPDAVDAATYFTQDEMDAQLGLCADYGRLCGRFANARAFGLIVR